MTPYRWKRWVQLYRLAGRSRLVAMIEELRTASLAYNHLCAAADVPCDAPRLDAEHREILAACQAGDPVRAVNAVRHHIAQTIVHLMNVLEPGEKPEKGATTQANQRIYFLHSSGKSGLMWDTPHIFIEWRPAFELRHLHDFINRVLL